MIQRKAALAQILTCLALSCADPPTFHLPLSTQFPVDDVRLGMTFGELRQARPEVMVVPDSAMVVEELFRGRYHYAFTSQRRNRAPSRGARLAYIDRVDEEIPGDYARRRWDSLVAALTDELDIEPRCSSIVYARLNWKRATFREDGQPVAGAVDVVGITIGDPGPGEAQLVTRLWLAEFVSPMSPRLDAPALARSRLAAGEVGAENDCIEG